MKHILSFLTVLCSLLATGCASRHAAQTENASISFAQYIADSLQAGTFVMEADYMYPQRTSAQGLIAGYAVQVSNTQVHSRLPYRGHAFHSSMEMEKNGPLHFDAYIANYSVNQYRKACWLVDFDAINGQEHLHYAFRFSPNGRILLKVTSSDRDWIVFEGWLSK